MCKCCAPYIVSVPYPKVCQPLVRIGRSRGIVCRPTPCCPPPCPPSNLIGGCAGTQYGCCPDGITAKVDQAGSNCTQQTPCYPAPCCPVTCCPAPCCPPPCCPAPCNPVYSTNITPFNCNYYCDPSLKLLYPGDLPVFPGCC